MVIATERNTWPLWRCLSATSLAMLIQYQWKHYGTKLDLLVDRYKELESLPEIDRLMRERPRYRGKVWFGG